MTAPATDSLLTKYVRIFLVVSGYWIISILTVFVNKTLLSEIDLDAPMFIAFSQTVLSAIICFGMGILHGFIPGLPNFNDSSAFDVETIKMVAPLAILFTAMIGMNNLCLKYVTVAFYYIGRSLTTIFNVGFTYLILNEKTSKSCIFFCFIIILGFYLGVDQESIAGSLSVTGTIFGVLASLSLSLYAIYTKRILPKLNQDVWLLSYYNNIYSSFLFLILILLNGELITILNYKKLFQISIWFILILGGLCGFAVGIFTALQIKYTSALTHNISGTAKACAQTVLATYWYNDTKSYFWWLSNFVVLFGTAGYARVKQLEMEVKHKSSTLYQKV